MPFPFLPFGAIVAASVMILALTLFGLALRTMDRAASRAASELRLSIVPGVVAGMRRWVPEPGSDPASEPARPPSTGSVSGFEIVDLEARD